MSLCGVAGTSPTLGPTTAFRLIEEIADVDLDVGMELGNKLLLLPVCEREAWLARCC